MLATQNGYLIAKSRGGLTGRWTNFSVLQKQGTSAESFRDLAATNKNQCHRVCGNVSVGACSACRRPEQSPIDDALKQPSSKVLHVVLQVLSGAVA